MEKWKAVITCNWAHRYSFLSVCLFSFSFFLSFRVLSSFFPSLHSYFHSHCLSLSVFAFSTSCLLLCSPYLYNRIYNHCSFVCSFIFRGRHFWSVMTIVSVNLLFTFLVMFLMGRCNLRFAMASSGTKVLATKEVVFLSKQNLCFFLNRICVVHKDLTGV